MKKIPAPIAAIPRETNIARVDDFYGIEDENAEKWIEQFDQAVIINN